MTAGISMQSVRNLLLAPVPGVKSNPPIGMRHNLMRASAMSYPVIDPSKTLAARASECALAVMAKAPRPGKVKTRLSPPLTLEQSAAINICFLKDTTENLAAVAGPGRAAGVISYTPVGDEGLFDGLLPEGF